MKPVIVSRPRLTSSNDADQHHCTRTRKQRGRILALLLILVPLLWTIESGVPINLRLASDVGRGPNAMVPPCGSTVTVQPSEIDDILYNPGMGFADFHLGFGNPPLPPASILVRRSPTSAGLGLILSLPKGNTTSFSSIA